MRNKFIKIFFFILIIFQIYGCTGGLMVRNPSLSETIGGGDLGSESYLARVGLSNYLSASTLSSPSYLASVSSANSVLTMPLESTNFQITDPLLDAFLN